MFPSPDVTLSYQLLLADVVWCSQSYGEPGYRAYGWFPNAALSPKLRHRAVQVAYRTFVTYDPRGPLPVKELDGKPEYPRPLALCHQYELSYINAHPSFVRAALANYFTATLPGRGFSVTIIDDEDTGAGYEVDLEGLNAFAAQCADHFMANAITTRCFLADPDTYSLHEHGAHVKSEDSGSRIEALVDAS